MRLPAGTRIGPYRIVALIGAGGMGEVYRADDTTLHRAVAIKVLPDHLSNDGERLQRFTREAQTLASLNHPNIAAIYGFEKIGDLQALVIELVEGEDLSERIARGRIAVDETLRIARQIAEAFDTAHELGIIHRDLKPANIKVRADGTVKVLDYGLAKAAEPVGATPASLSMSPTITTPLMTQGGVVLGTAAYMSPEQARGKVSDKRTDIWAFGCVVYEMLTGQAAFAGDTVADTIAAILGREPDWSALPPATPVPIRRMLVRCLDKDARRRLRDIGDASADIADVMSNATTLPPETEAGSATSVRDPQAVAVLVRQHRARDILAGVVLLAAIASAALLLRPEASEQVRRNSIVSPDGYSFAPLIEGGAPALSPDGTKIAFVAQGGAKRSLWVQSLDAFDAKSLTGTDGAAGPFWSPKGDELAFFADGSLKTVKLDGGSPRVLATGIRFTSQGALPGTWNNEGTLLFRHQDGILWKVSSKGGEATPAMDRKAAAIEQDHYSATFLPDGRHLILLIRRGAELRLEVAVGELGSNSRTTLLRDITNAQYAPGTSGRPSHLVFVRDGRLIARPFDDERLELTGAEVTLADDVAVTLGGGLGDFSVSANGVLAYRRAAAGPQEDMAWYDRAGKKVGAIGDRRGHPRNIVRLSPSGKKAVFTRQGPLTQEVWIADVTTGYPALLTNNGRSPVWSPDESEIAFLRQDESDRSDPPIETVYRKKIDGGAEVPVWSRPAIMAINDWSGDGHQLLTIFETTRNRAELWLLLSRPTPSAILEPVRLGYSLHAQFVPSKGSTLAIIGDGLIVRGMPGAKPGPWQVGSAAATHPRWRSDGQELFFHDNGYLQVVERVGSPTEFRFGAPRRLFALPFAFQIAGGQMTPGWDVTPDGQRFLVTSPPPDTPTSIAIVTHWDVE